MSFTVAQYQALKSELLTDPKSYGYVAQSNTDVLAGMLNLVRAGEQVAQTNLTSAQIFQAIAPTEWTATNIVLLKFQYLQILIEVGSGSGRIDLSNGNVKAALDLIFPVGTCPLTNAAHHALYLRNGSRVETLFGPGVSVTSEDVSTAQVS
jgi:hypothetical protein